MNNRRHFLKKFLESSMLMSIPAVPNFVFASPEESSFIKGQKSDKQQLITDEEV